MYFEVRLITQGGKFITSGKTGKLLKINYFSYKYIRKNED